MNLTIRPYRQKDYEQIIDICLKTGKSGEDACELFYNKELLGLYYAVPYIIKEPEICFVAANESDEAVGYILGTKNSPEFSIWCEKNWFPKYREKYSLSGQYKSPFEKRIVELIHSGYIPRQEAALYPAHLHIDLLPEAQGRGVGKELIHTFISKLQEFNIHGLHLEVGKKNRRAQGFYKKLGFTLICEYEYSILFGMKLSE